MQDTRATAEPFELAYPVGGRRPLLLVHNRHETISNFVRYHNIWQRRITAFIANALQPGDVFVDVGANIGYFTVYAALAVGSSGKVHAIEPDHDNAALLTENLKLNSLSNVTLHRLGISDRLGKATLFRSRFNAGAHSLLPQEGLDRGPEISLMRLDDLLEGEDTPKLIKIDVQGSEMAVLRSAGRLLTRPNQKPGLILECAPLALKRNDGLAELLEFAAMHAYDLRAFIANDKETTMPPQLRRATLKAIAEDFIAAGDASEFDLLLLPRA